MTVHGGIFSWVRGFNIGRRAIRAAPARMLCVAVVFLAATPVTAQDTTWVVAQIGADGASSAASVAGLLRARGIHVATQDSIRARLENAGVVELEPLPPEIGQVLARTAEAALERVAAGEDDEVVAMATGVLGEASRHIARLGREEQTAIDVANLCLYVVRAHLHAGRGDDARTQARECIRLVPDLEPESRLHPPDVRALVAREAQRLESDGSHVLVAQLTSEARANCRLRLNGRDMGSEIRRALPAGRYFVEAVCGSSAADFVHIAEMRSPSTVRVQATPLLHAGLRFEGAVPVLRQADPAVIFALARFAAADRVVTVASSGNAVALTRYDVSPRGAAWRADARWTAGSPSQRSHAVDLILRPAAATVPTTTAADHVSTAGRPIWGPILVGAVGVAALSVVGVGLAGRGCLREDAGRCVEERNVDTTAALAYGGVGAAGILGAILWHLLGADTASHDRVEVSLGGLVMQRSF